MAGGKLGKRERTSVKAGSLLAEKFACNVARLERFTKGDCIDERCTHACHNTSLRES